MRIEDKKVLSELCKDWAETGIVVDFLEDADATIGDVLSLYAGRPPHWVDGLYKPILDEFLRRKDEPERAREVAAIDDGSPRSLVSRMNLVYRHLPEEIRTAVAGRNLYPTGWRELSNRANWVGREDELHCHGCCRSEKCKSLGLLDVKIFPMPEWWPTTTLENHDESLLAKVAAYQCRSCTSLMLFFNPHHWWPVRERKREVLLTFPDVTVPDLKHCRCNSNDMMFRPCRTCNGSGWWFDGTCWADRLIPEPADKT